MLSEAAIITIALVMLFAAVFIIFGAGFKRKPRCYECEKHMFEYRHGFGIEPEPEPHDCPRKKKK